MTDSRCAHCAIDHHGEQRYAALPGWHDWKREPSPLERLPVRVEIYIDHRTPDPEPEPLARSVYRRLWPPHHEPWIRA